MTLTTSSQKTIFDFNAVLDNAMQFDRSFWRYHAVSHFQ